jgi:hypothetical protein
MYGIAGTPPSSHASVNVPPLSRRLLRFLDSCLMQSSAFVTVASLILGLAEILFTVTMAKRDRMIYRCLGSKVKGTTDVLALMKKHKLLRVRNAHMETVLEVWTARIPRHPLLPVIYSSSPAAPSHPHA